MFRENFKRTIFFSFLGHFLFFVLFFSSNSFFFSRVPASQETEIFITGFESISAKPILITSQKLNKKTIPNAPQILPKAPATGTPSQIKKTIIPPQILSLFSKISSSTKSQAPILQNRSPNPEPPLQTVNNLVQTDIPASQPIIDPISSPKQIFKNLNEEEKKTFKLEKSYRQILTRKVSSNWKLPDFAKGKNFKVKIRIVINKAGKIVTLKLLEPADEDLVNLAAKSAVLDSIPFPQMPKEFPEGKLLPITFSFSQ